jgi:hypothetical protein
MKKSIRCPDHNDKHASAVLYSRPDGSEWLHCKGCKANRLYKEADVKEEQINIEEYDESDYGTDVKQCLNDLELLEQLERDKGITAEMVYHFNGFITDKGYVGFPYAKDKEVYRRLIDDESKPRFINTSPNKGLVNQDKLKDWSEVFLVEGLTDWILFEWEVNENVTTSFGAELSEEQAYLLRDKTVFILFDRDFAGAKGAKQAEARLKEWGATPIIFELPDLDLPKKIDVNYLIHKGKESFIKWLNDKLVKYKPYDDGCLDRFKDRPSMKFYNTDIPLIKVSQGLYVISAPYGTGKTTMGVSLMDNFSSQGGQVLYCNYDSTEDEIIARLASRYTDCYTWSELEANPDLLNNDPEAEKRLKQCLKNIKIVNGLTIDEIKYSCKKYYSHAIIDYIQRVPNNDTDKVRGLERIMDVLSDLSSNEDMTIIGISRQNLSGGAYSGSASIPYHATGCIILTATDEGIISANIDKNRRGPTGTALFRTDFGHQRLKPTKLNQIADEKFKKLFPNEG